MRAPRGAPGGRIRTVSLLISTCVLDLNAMLAVERGVLFLVTHFLVTHCPVWAAGEIMTCIPGCSDAAVPAGHVLGSRDVLLGSIRPAVRAGGRGVGWVGVTRAHHSMILVGDEELKASVALLEAFAAGTAAPGTTDEALWRARRVKEAIIHPDTGEKVPLLFRMSFFAPANVPTVAGMILGSSTVRTAPDCDLHLISFAAGRVGEGHAHACTVAQWVKWNGVNESGGSQIVRQVFWQWMNQSYNAGFNWCNRNATVETATSQLLRALVRGVAASGGETREGVCVCVCVGGGGAESYGFATSVAVTTVMGLNWATKALARGGRLSPGVMSLLTMVRGLRIGACASAGRDPGRWRRQGVPYFAVAAAGACNSTAMRWREAQCV